MITGRVFRSTGSWYDVLIESEQRMISCRVVGKLKLEKDKLTNPIAVGDLVELSMENETQGIIKNILPRKNYIARQSPKSRLQLHLIASNIDQAILITSMREPTLKPGFIDRFLLTTEPQNIPVVLVFNKCDLFNPDDWEEYEELRNVYEKIGYQVCYVSANTGDGISALKEKLTDKISLFSGQSGVGKSSVINCIAPGIDLKTGDLSGYSGKGTHTTTFAQMFAIQKGTYIIDTPGIKTLTFNNLEPMDVAHNFREFFEYSESCRFGSQCTHRNEPACAVKKGLEIGEISESRYRSYLGILEEIEAQNYWERHKKY